MKFWDETTPDKAGVGGTESQIIELAKNLSLIGYDVTVAGNPEKPHTSIEGVKYVTIQYAFENLTGEHFDVGIFYQIEDSFKFLCGKRIFVPSIEYLFYASGIVDTIDKKKIGESNYKIIYLSEWHKNALKRYCSLDDNDFYYIPYGIERDETTLSFEDKENSMVWSSDCSRNFEWFMDSIYPKIKKNVPDFKVYLAGYANNKNIFEKYKDDIVFLGSLPYKELYKYQQKSKIWVYPNIGIVFPNFIYFHETFCITAVENALAKNAIICLGDGKDGITTTLDGYDLLPGNMFQEYSETNTFDDESVSNLLAASAIRCLLNKKVWFENVYSGYSNVFHKYDWKNVIERWKMLIEDN